MVTVPVAVMVFMAIVLIQLFMDSAILMGLLAMAITGFTALALLMVCMGVAVRTGFTAMAPPMAFTAIAPTVMVSGELAAQALACMAQADI